MLQVGGVVYEELPEKARALRQLGRDLDYEIKYVYRNVDEMRNSWHGTSYGNVARSFNDLMPLFSEILNLLIVTFPFSLEEVANNYAIVDKGYKICVATDERLEAIPTIQETTEEEFRFIEAEVDKTKQECFDSFSRMSEKLEEIQEVMDSIRWQSDAATVFRERFETLKDRISDSLGEIQRSFLSSMNDMITNVQLSEKRNMGDNN